MKKKHNHESLDSIIITQLTPQSAIDLMKHEYFKGSDVLNHGQIYELKQSLKLIPYATKLVAYDLRKETAVGFLCLKEISNRFFLIEKVFVNPNYRKRGIATRLFNKAFIIAKQRGAKKVNLHVYSSAINAINLYKKLGFNELDPMLLLAQGSVFGFQRSRIIRRAVLGQGYLTKLAFGKAPLFKFPTKSKRNREKLFDIYRSSVDQVWIDFFEINSNNLLNGSRDLWQPSFFKEILINDTEDSFAVVFNYPLKGKAKIEVHSNKTAINCFLQDLLSILSKRGVGFVSLTLPNCDIELSSWFAEKKMKTYHFVAMGKIL